MRIMCRGEDQTLFTNCSLFEKLGGFRSDFIIMEDFDPIQKIQKEVDFKIIPKDVVISARKFDKNQYLKVNFAFLMYFFEACQKSMSSAYKNTICHPKF